MEYMPSNEQKADISTKAFRDISKWNDAVSLINMKRMAGGADEGTSLHQPAGRREWEERGPKLVAH